MFSTIKEKLEEVNTLVGQGKATDALVLLPQIKALLVETEERIQATLEDVEVKEKYLESGAHCWKETKCIFCKVFKK